jgi:hypothetical protein
MEAEKRGGKLNGPQALALFEKTLDEMRPMRTGVEVTDLATTVRVRLEKFGPGLDTKIAIVGNRDRFDPRLKQLMKPSGGGFEVTVKDLLQVLAAHVNTLSQRNANLHKGSEQAAIVSKWKPKNEAMREVRDALVNFVKDDGKYSNDELLTLLELTTKNMTKLKSAADVITTAREVWSAALPRIPAQVWVQGLSWDEARMTSEFNAYLRINTGKVNAANVHEVFDTLLLTADGRAGYLDSKTDWGKKRLEEAQKSWNQRGGHKTNQSGGH